MKNFEKLIKKIIKLYKNEIIFDDIREVQYPLGIEFSIFSLRFQQNTIYLYRRADEYYNYNFICKSKNYKEIYEVIKSIKKCNKE